MGFPQDDADINAGLLERLGRLSAENNQQLRAIESLSAERDLLRSDLKRYRAENEELCLKARLQEMRLLAEQDTVRRNAIDEQVARVRHAANLDLEKLRQRCEAGSQALQAARNEIQALKEAALKLQRERDQLRSARDELRRRNLELQDGLSEARRAASAATDHANQMSIELQVAAERFQAIRGRLEARIDTLEGELEGRTAAVARVPAVPTHEGSAAAGVDLEFGLAVDRIAELRENLDRERSARHSAAHELGGAPVIRQAARRSARNLTADETPAALPAVENQP